jgi:hypothetical protein
MRGAGALVCVVSAIYGETIVSFEMKLVVSDRLAKVTSDVGKYDD